MDFYWNDLMNLRAGEPVPKALMESYLRGDDRAAIARAFEAQRKVNQIQSNCHESIAPPLGVERE